MLSNYRGKPLGQGAMMVFTDNELNKLHQEGLRPYCVATDGKYLCRMKVGTNIKTYHKHDTPELCNAQYDKILNSMKH